MMWKTGPAIRLGFFYMPVKKIKKLPIIEER